MNFSSIAHCFHCMLSQHMLLNSDENFRRNPTTCAVCVGMTASSCICLTAQCLSAASRKKNPQLCDFWKTREGGPHPGLPKAHNIMVPLPFTQASNLTCTCQLNTYHFLLVFCYQKIKPNNTTTRHHCNQVLAHGGHFSL